MKKFFFVLCILIAGAFFTLSVGYSFWRGEVLSAEKVEKKWGLKALDVTMFKNGSMDVRASMAKSLLDQKKKFIGKSVPEVREIFGRPNGFYFTDIFPAYMIEEAKTHADDSWQIVFLLDNERRVKDVIVHKNCCD